MTPIEKMTTETLTQNLIQGTTDINALNLAKATQKDAFLQAIKKRPNLLAKVKEANVNHFLKCALNENPEYFIYLKKEQYTDELAQIYLEARLKTKAPSKNATSTEEKNLKISVQKSLDEKLVFVYFYVTPDGEELCYYDHELQVPSSIRSSIKLSLKLESALAFIEKMDTHITQLGEKKIKTVLTDVIIAKYKAYFTEYLTKNKVGYYTLCASCEGLESGFKKELGAIFKDYGIQVSQFFIKKLAIPKDIQYKIEDLSFQIRQQRANIEADAEFAKKSLENYESKLAIEQKYPDTEHTLTEYEKDLALKRYLVKTGRLSEEEIDHSIKLQQKTEQADTALEKQADVVPEIEPKPNTFRTGFICGLVLSIIVSLFLFFAGTGAGLIALGVTTAIFGTVAAFNYEKLKSPTIEIKTEEDENVGSQN